MCIRDSLSSISAQYCLTNGFSIDPIRIARLLALSLVARSIFRCRPNRSLNSLTSEPAKNKSSFDALDGTTTGAWLSRTKSLPELEISCGSGKIRDWSGRHAPSHGTLFWPAAVGKAANDSP